MTSQRATLQRPSMETPKHRFNTRVCTSPADTSVPSPTASVVKPPIRTLGTLPPPEVPDTRGGSASAAFVPMAGLKPMAGGIRRMSPFGLPKREGQPERTSRRTGGVASSQVDPPQGGSGARVHRHRRWRNRWPLRLPECMDGPASPASVTPPASPREVRLNGFPGVLAEVHRHSIAGCVRRVPDAAPTGFSDARFVVQPAYSLGPHSVRPLRRLAGGCAPSDPRTGNGAP